MKFRVYDKLRKEYSNRVFYMSIDDKLFYLNIDGKLVETVGDQFIVEQCTNKYDEQNKLIYVGDVLQSIDKSGNHKYTVIQKNNLILLSNNNDNNPCWHGGYYKIIGNIHEKL